MLVFNSLNSLLFDEKASKGTEVREKVTGQKDTTRSHYCALLRRRKIFLISNFKRSKKQVWFYQ